MKRSDLELVAPKCPPVLDPNFSPAVLACQAYEAAAAAHPLSQPVTLAIEQADGSVFHYSTKILPDSSPAAAGTFRYLERICKFLLWGWGGFRVFFDGPLPLGQALQRYYTDTPTGRFDAQIMGERIYERPFEIRLTRNIPAPHGSSTPQGRHLDGCRIGFDLGGSDRKVAAVQDGQPVFSEEVAWDPVPQADPQYHFEGVMDSIKRAAAHLPRVDAIGGSAAGVYVNNRAKVASLFRSVPTALFQTRVKEMFLEMRKAWGGIPFEVVNDGEVTALAGSMALGVNAVLGIAMGTSQAGGYVTPEGNITSWLNELAFAPIDYHPEAPADEWSGDRGCGVQYFSQQAVARLIAPSGLEIAGALPLPEKLIAVQARMTAGDDRARRIYQTIGSYLGYAVAHYARFYSFLHVLVLGRVTSGIGGDIILDEARRVLKGEFPILAASIRFHTPDEKEKRHGQAIAAASLPNLRR
jgi:predicted NBD/HSP70 family sugar kinase